MILLENAKIYTMAEDPFTGSLLIDDKKIKTVSKEKISADDAQKIDCNGKCLLPGFIDAHTHQGLYQGEIGWAGKDINESNESASPQLRGIDAFNPFDPSLRDAPCGGVTIINTGPGSGNVMGGLFFAVKTYGDVLDDMLVKNPTALKLAFGENPKGGDKGPQTRMAVAALLREWLFKARDYHAKLLKAKTKKDDDDDDAPEFDMKLDVLAKVLSREIPVHAHCHRADDIVTAIRIAEEFGIDMALIHATEGHKIAEYIKRKNIPCIVGPSIVGREKPELAEISFATPGILSSKGVDVCLQSDTYPPQRYFQTILCLAIKEGMEQNEALRAVTVSPAKLLGIFDRVGSIEQGKDADLVLWSGDPREFYSRVEMTFIDGKIVYQRDND